MWEFIERINIPGFEVGQNGNISFKLTEEEKKEVDRIFDMFKGYAIHRDVADDFNNGSISFALCNYAKQQFSLFEMDIQTKESPTSIEKALAAIVKAYSFYKLPIYLYDIACGLEKVGNIEESKKFFVEFLKRQAEYQTKQIDAAFMKHRDIDKALNDAKEKIAEI
ncbi:MAG: hypothetical protein JXA96_17805 [Sedimentisphaerales bacterium]|nr:hypothetical protein [Sedimentisphaerales bacterium]